MDKLVVGFVAGMSFALVGMAVGQYFINLLTALSRSL